MSDNKYFFERLTPTDDVDLDVYEDAINYVFENADIRNVAISGAYSAGKSSVLASYKKKHSNLKFLHISLAHFQALDEEKEETNGKENEETNGKENDIKEEGVKESILEGKILNQLMHQIPAERIPQTNFRVKTKVDYKSIIKTTVEIILFLLALAYFSFFDIWKDYVVSLPDNRFKTMLFALSHKYMLLIDGFVIILLLGLSIYKIIKIQKNKNMFRKFSLQGNEIEIFEESEDSYFDKYLNEVLYLFENAQADVIVFEDMDRFNANRIFERLREVNTLANIQLQKENKQLLRFFYLLRDDIFVSKDRTKFFDYIIPVIPVVDSSNSYNKFISLLKKSGIYEKFNEGFLQGLSLYIDDMRLLKNIYNEFLIYFNRLNTTELDCNKMLAIIAYKNLFPRDFSDLQLNKGFVDAIFSSKNQFILDEISAIQKNISEKEKMVTSIKNEHLSSMRELNVAFADKYLKGYSWYQYSNNDLDSFVSNHLRGNNLEEYLFRKQVLLNSLNNNLNVLQNEISNLEQEMLAVKNKKLCQIITRENVNRIFNVTSINEIGHETFYNEIKSSEYFDLLKYLIRNGYIDETYSDYMTYFYENSLSRIDKTFLRSVTDQKAKDYTYTLKNPHMIVSRLKLVDFSQEEILNFDLFTHLLQKLTSIEYLERFFEQLKKQKNFKFIGEYFNVTTELPNYVKYMNINWPEMFSTALSTQSLTEKQLYDYSIYTIYYSDEETIGLVNKEACLCDYISDMPNYLAIENPNIDKLIQGFKLLKVSFVGFDYEGINKELFGAVYENHLFEINYENIRLMLQVFFEVKNEDSIRHKNYTHIFSCPKSALTEYIEENICKYLDVILEQSNGKICDGEEAILSILNNPEVSVEQKTLYIEYLQTKVDNIDSIKDNTLWKVLISNDRVLYNESNIMEYFSFLESVDNFLVEFINRHSLSLNFTKVKMKYSEEQREKLFDAVAICDLIEDIKYKQIMSSLEFHYEIFDVPNISGDKLSILMDARIIRMNPDTLEFLRANYSQYVMGFIQSYIKEYVDMMESNLFSEKELLEIITWDIEDEYKIKLLEFTNSEISLVGKEYSPTICLHILNNNFMESDLPMLFLSYEKWENSIQTKIFDFAVSNITNIIEDVQSVSEELKHKLIHSGKLDRDTKIDLFIVMLPDMKESDIKEILPALNLDDFLKIFETHSRPKFQVNDENQKLLTAFKEYGALRDFEENPDREGYFKIIRSKSAKTLPNELL